MQMKLIRRISITLLTIVMAGAFAADGVMAEPDAPRSCTTVSPKGQLTNFMASVEITETSESTLFTYTLDTPGANPDHAVLAMDCLSECEASFCSIGENPCTTTADCTDGNEDVCVVDTECISNFGSPDNNGSSLNACGGSGDAITGIGFAMLSTMTMVANPEADTSTFFVKIAGPVTCDSGDIGIKNGKKFSSCEICVPKTTLDEGPIVADSDRIITQGPCRFLRRFKRGRLFESSVLENPDGEPQCEGIVLSLDETTGEFIAAHAGEPGLPPFQWSDLELKIDDAMGGSISIGPGLGQQLGAFEFTTGPGKTCVVINDGFGGTGLTCTCAKPLSPGESAHCGK
jgi:hypothetical protein